MRAFFQSPLAWLPLFCAALSAGLWGWSRRLPESHWETTATLPAPAAIEPASEPATPLNEAPGENSLPPTSSPALAEKNAPQSTPVPTPNTGAVAAATPPPAEPTPPPPSPAPKPSDAELVGPLPAHPEPTVASAQPNPESAASIAPPAPLDLAEIARQPELWPKQVLLLASARFPVILNGVNVGNIQIPPGRTVLLLKVNLDGTVEIGLQGSQASPAKVNARATDLLARAQALAAARKRAAPATPAP